MNTTLQTRLTTTRDNLYQRLSIALFLILSAVVLFSFRDYGLSWDEGLQKNMGEDVLRFYTSYLHDRSALSMGDLNNYGGFFEMLGAIAARVLPFGLYESRHLLIAISGVLGILAAWKIGRLLAGPGAAFWTATLLILYPPYYGHMFINSKDIPFAALYVWSLYYLILLLRELPNVSWKTTGKLALATGLTMGVRVGGLILLCYLGLFVGISCLYFYFRRRDSIRSNPSILARSLGAIALVPPVAYTIMLVFWPYAMSRPFERPYTTLHWLAHVKAVVSPWDYIPRLLLYKLPEIHLLLLLIALCLGIRALLSFRTSGEFTDMLSYILLAFSFLFPVCYAISVAPFLYDEIRHFLFVIPPLICLAGITLNWILEILFQRAVWGKAVLAVIVICLVIQARTMVMLHPYEYVYFNRLIGGIAGATHKGLAEGEYWATSYKEGVNKLRAYLIERDGDAFGRTQYKILVGSAPWCATYYFPPNFIQVSEAPEASIYLSTTRWGGGTTHSGKEVVTVGRTGIPFVVAKVLDDSSTRK